MKKEILTVYISLELSKQLAEFIGSLPYKLSKSSAVEALLEAGLKHIKASK